MIDDDPPDKDKLAIPDTRPNMFLFVPYELAMVFFIGFFAIDNQTHSLKNGLIVLPFWIISALLVRRDVNGVRVFFVRTRLIMLHLDQYRWGGLSTSPWPLKDRTPRDAV
jgi:type IV secretory pathway VirB3-like protein